MKITFYFLLTLALISSLGYVACGPKAPPPPFAGETKPVEARPEKTWQGDWQKALAEARKEGELSVYTSGLVQVLPKIAKKFKETYGITVSALTAGSPSELMERIPRESQAGIFNVDVTLAGRNLPISLMSKGLVRPLNDIIILPEVLDGNKWVQGTLPFFGSNYQVWFAGGINSGIWRNTELVQENEIKEYSDLLKPQYKGKIVFVDPTIIGGGSIWFRNYYPVLGKDFMEALVRQEPLLSRDRRLSVEWLARGKYSLLLGGSLEETLHFKGLGAPIKSVETKEGEFIHAGVNSIAMASTPAHLGAARVFINWILTKEGQTLYSEGLLVPSFRADTPTAHLDPATIPKRGKNYFTDPPEILAKSEEYLASAKQIFAPILK